jgi:hypothetical protein
MDNSTARLGLLFVHGIGDRPQGSTLVEFARPLCEWIRQRAEQVDGKLQVVEANLCPGLDAPGHAVIDLSVHGASSRWLLAESWWAETFRPPRFKDVLTWGFEVIPSTLGSHFGKRLLRAVSLPTPKNLRETLLRSGRILQAFLSLLAGLLASLLALFVLFLMLLAVLIPIRRIRAAIGSLQRKISSSLGDSFVLIDNPINEAAIVSRVRRDINWLRAQGCRRVVVVAHSQGGAVSVRALHDDATQADRLVTFGSGLRKLEELSHLRREGAYKRPAWLALGGVVVVGFALLGFFGGLAEVRAGRAGEASAVISALLLVVGIGLTSGGVGLLLTSSDPTSLRQFQQAFRSRSLSRKFRWVDIYSSHDPVPNGALFSTDPEPPIHGGWEVSNLRSLTLDHNSYWKNLDLK